MRGAIQGKVDFGQLRSVIRKILKDTDKDAVKLINKAMLHVLIGGVMDGKRYLGATRLTRRAKKADIERDLMVEVGGRTHIRRLRAAAIHQLKKRGAPKTEWSRRVMEMSGKILRSRISAIGYTARLGWDEAIKKLGGRGFKRQKRYSHSEARKGRADLATNGRALVKALNTAPGIIVASGVKALDIAQRNVARDMAAHHVKRMLARAAKKAGMKVTS